jgi:hypothetical protein
MPFPSSIKLELIAPCHRRMCHRSCGVKMELDHVIPPGRTIVQIPSTMVFRFVLNAMPGKSYNVLMRLYGPLQPWFDKTWKPGDFELVE